MKETATLQRKDILDIFQNSNPEAQDILKKKLGEEFFEPAPEDDLLTVEGCIKAIGRTVENTIPFPGTTDPFQDWVNASAEMAAIYQAYNKNQFPDWSDEDQEKLVAWYDLSIDSGFGLSFNDVDFVRSGSDVASRLHLLERRHVKLIFERFPDVVKRYMTNPRTP